MNLPWLTSISRMLSQQGASLKGSNGVTSTKTQKYFCTYTIKTRLSPVSIYLGFSCYKNCQKTSSRSPWTLKPQQVAKTAAKITIVQLSQEQGCSRVSPFESSISHLPVLKSWKLRTCQGQIKSLQSPWCSLNRETRASKLALLCFSLVLARAYQSSSDTKVNMWNQGYLVLHSKQNLSPC